MPGEGYESNKDPRKSDVRVVVEDWKGMAPSQDPHDVDPGLSAWQVNCESVHPGELRARAGMEYIITGTVTLTPAPPPTPPPGPPSDLVAVVQGDQVALSWTASTSAGAAGYDIYRSTTEGFPAGPASRVATRIATAYLDSPPGPGTYYYLVTAFDPAGQSSGPSNEASATVLAPPPLPPGAVTGLTATASGHEVDLAWTPPATGGVVTGYDVYRSTTEGFAPGADNRIATTSGATYADPGLAAGTYYYLVDAFNAAGQSGPASNEASATIVALAPGAVTALTATVTGTRVDLAWTAPTTGDAVAGYDVYRSATSGFTPGAGSLIGTTAVLTYADVGLAAGTYYYLVAAFDAQAEQGPPSGEASATIAPPPPPNPPGAVTGLTATAAGSTINLAWTAPTTGGAVRGYDVYRSATSGFTPGPSNRIGSAAGPTYADTGLAAGTYYYLVMAFDAQGESGPASNQATATVAPAPPGAVTGLTATVTGTRVDLAWNAPTGGGPVDTYHIYRSTTSGFTPGPPVLIAMIRGRTYADTGLAAGTYYYLVMAFDAQGRPGPQSNQATATVQPPPPDPGPPGAVTALTATASGPTINLAWTAPTTGGAVTGYDVYRSTTAGFTPGAGNLLGTTTARTYADPGLAVGTYYYRVAAFDAAGRSGPASNQATATVATAPSGPVVVRSWIPKSGVFIAFGVESTKAPAHPGGVSEPAPIRAVNGTPTVTRNGVPVAIGAPVWRSVGLDVPLVTYRLQCGSVRTISIGIGQAGTGYTAPVVTWNGDGGGTGLTLGTPTLTAAGGLAWVPITESSDDFTSVPTFSISDPAGTGCVLNAIMDGVRAGDAIAYTAADGWLTAVLGGSPQWRTPAQGGTTWGYGTAYATKGATDQAVDNWAGRLEGASGGFAAFAQTPTMASGANISAQGGNQVDVGVTAKNRVLACNGWSCAGGGVLTVDADHMPVSWTAPGTSTVQTVVLAIFNKGPLGDIWPGQPGIWTLQYDDSAYGTLLQATVTLGGTHATPLDEQVAGHTVTRHYSIAYAPGVVPGSFGVSIQVKAPASTDGKGHWTLSNIKVIPPDNRDHSAQPVTHGESDLLPDPNVQRGLAGLGVGRWMDSTQGYGGGPDGNTLNPGDYVQGTAPVWNPVPRNFTRTAVAARYINTDPSSATYAWSSTELSGPQGFFTPTIPWAPGDDGQALGGGPAVVCELRTAQPHGLVTGRYVTVGVDAKGVAVPVVRSDGATGTYRPTYQATPVFVTGPDTLCVNLYYPSFGLANSDVPMRIDSTTEVDLTAGGTLPGWTISVAFSRWCVPYRYSAAFAANMPDCACWTNLPLFGTDACYQGIAREIAAELAQVPGHDVWLEFANEIWNGGFSSNSVLQMLWRVMGQVPAGQEILGGWYTGTGKRPPGWQNYAAGVPMAAYAYEVFTTAAVAAGIDASRIKSVYGSQFTNPALTDAIATYANPKQARVDHVAVATYYDIPQYDPPLKIAYTPFGTGQPAGCESWPCDGLNDLTRHMMTYSAQVQWFYRNHYASCQKIWSKPTLVCYEGGISNLVPANTWQWNKIQIDCTEHPSARDLVWGWCASCQWGDPTTPGSGAVAACYYLAYNHPNLWWLGQGLGQATGPGLHNQFATFQGGFPADQHDHAVVNQSPGLQGLVDWGTAARGTLLAMKAGGGRRTAPRVLDVPSAEVAP